MEQRIRVAPAAAVYRVPARRLALVMTAMMMTTMRARVTKRSVAAAAAGLARRKS